MGQYLFFQAPPQPSPKPLPSCRCCQCLCPGQKPRKLLIKKLSDRAKPPMRKSDQAAGYDLYSAEDVVICRGGGCALVKTDVAVALPEGCYGRIAARSGIALNHKVGIMAGVVDQDYRGGIGVLMFNLSPDEEFRVQCGDRVAQLVLEKICTPPIEEVRELDKTVRGSKGYGSTGQ